MKRFRQWWQGRPYHSVFVLDEKTNKRVDKIKFADADWTSIMLSMGALGCRTAEEALVGAFRIAVMSAEEITAAHKKVVEQVPVELEAHTGQYL